MTNKDKKKRILAKANRILYTQQRKKKIEHKISITRVLFESLIANKMHDKTGDYHEIHQIYDRKQ